MRTLETEEAQRPTEGKIKVSITLVSLLSIRVKPSGLEFDVPIQAGDQKSVNSKKHRGPPPYRILQQLLIVDNLMECRVVITCEPNQSGGGGLQRFLEFRLFGHLPAILEVFVHNQAAPEAGTVWQLGLFAASFQRNTWQASQSGRQNIQ